MTKITTFFSPVLPKREIFDTELDSWKSEWSEVPQAEWEKATLLDKLQLADKNFYPNVHEIIKLLLLIELRGLFCSVRVVKAKVEAFTYSKGVFEGRVYSFIRYGYVDPS